MTVGRAGQAPLHSPSLADLGMRKAKPGLRGTWILHRSNGERLWDTHATVVITS